MKVSELYNLFSIIDTNNIKDIECYKSDEVDSITVVMHLYNPIEQLPASQYSEELTVQIINTGNTIEITVVNSYESEEELYETRFNGRKQSYTPKWS